MAIIINELEVVLEAPALPTHAASAAPAPPSSGQPVQPIDFVDVREKQARAEWRVMAH